MSVHVDTSQLRALAADFGAAAASVHSRTDRAFDRGGRLVQTLARGNAPIESGDLRDSITVDAGSLHFSVGPTVIYGDYVERGTSEMAPEPYLGPAFDQALPTVLTDIADSLLPL